MNSASVVKSRPSPAAFSMSTTIVSTIPGVTPRRRQICSLMSSNDMLERWSRWYMKSIQSLPETLRREANGPTGNPHMYPMWNALAILTSTARASPALEAESCALAATRGIRRIFPLATSKIFSPSTPSRLRTMSHAVSGFGAGPLPSSHLGPPSAVTNPNALPELSPPLRTSPATTDSPPFALNGSMREASKSPCTNALLTWDCAARVRTRPPSRNLGLPSVSFPSGILSYSRTPSAISFWICASSLACAAADTVVKPFSSAPISRMSASASPSSFLGSMNCPFFPLTGESM